MAHAREFWICWRRALVRFREVVVKRIAVIKF